MKRLFIPLCLLGIGLFLIQSCTTFKTRQIVENRLQPFNTGWKFIKDSLKGAEASTFDDSKWRTLDLPHDWSIEDLPASQPGGHVGPFSKVTPGGFLTGHTLGGTGWYRKQFTVGSKDKGKQIKVLFDGVMTESDVWINGTHLGYHPNGYTPFAYDLTPYLNPAGKINVLAVRVKNLGQTSRWYSGTGIYRNVNLIVTDPVHIDLWGINVTTPEVSKEKAKVNVAVKVMNDSKQDVDITVNTRLIGSHTTATVETNKTDKIVASGSVEVTRSFTLDNPELWSPDSPNMYNLEVSVLSKGKLVDAYILKVGVRSIKYNTQNGLQINGKTVKLHGACMHHDNGLLGAAAFDRAEERRVAIMKANGFNAIRCSHNMPSPRFLEACDSLGMLVMDEVFDTWTKPKTPQDYHL